MKIKNKNFINLTVYINNKQLEIGLNVLVVVASQRANRGARKTNQT